MAIDPLIRFQLIVSSNWSKLGRNNIHIYTYIHTHIHIHILYIKYVNLYLYLCNGLQQVSPDPIKCTIVFKCAGQGKLVYNGSLLSLALCGIMWTRSSAPPPPEPTLPPLKKVYKQPSRGMDLDGAHQEGS